MRQKPPVHLVLTRHPGQAGEMEAAARRAGYDVRFMPLTQQQLPEDLSELICALEDLRRGAFDWLLLTSPNTVRALRACSWDGLLPAETSVAVVGPGTARVLHEHTGLRPHWMPYDHSAAGVLAELPRPTELPRPAAPNHPAEGRRMLLPQSAQARPELADGLRARGWELTHVVAYRSVARDDRADGSRAPASQSLALLQDVDADDADLLEPADLRHDDVVLVTSSTAAEAYAGLQAAGTAPPTPGPVLLAIGRPTAETLTRLRLPVAAVLPEPTAEGLLSTVNELESAVNEQGLSGSSESLDWS